MGLHIDVPSKLILYGLRYILNFIGIEAQDNEGDWLLPLHRIGMLTGMAMI